MQMVFARHAESQANVEQVISNRNLPHDLTAKGTRQAYSLADKLESKKVVAIYASPLRRAQQTARILAEKWPVPVHSTDALREFDCGIMEGRSDQEAWQAHRGVMAAWDDQQDYERRIAGGESFEDMRERFVPFIKELIDEFQGEGDIILVGHGALLMQMLPVVLSNVDRAFTRDHPLGNCAHVVAVPHKEDLVCVEWDGLPLP